MPKEIFTVRNWIPLQAAILDCSKAAVQRKETSVQRPECRVQSPASRVQRPTLASRVQEFRYANNILINNFLIMFDIHYRNRSNSREMFLKKKILKICTIHPCRSDHALQSLILIKFLCTFSEIIFQSWYFSVYHRNIFGEWFWRNLYLLRLLVQ